MAKNGDPAPDAGGATFRVIGSSVLRGAGELAFVGLLAGGVNGTDYRLKQAKVRHRFKNVPGGALKLQEEKSKDKETKHKKEAVSVMTLGRGLFAQQASDVERDTTAIRRR